MPLTSGLIPAAAVCAVAGTACVRVLSTVARRAGAAQRAYAVLWMALVGGAVGVVGAAVIAVGWSGSPERSMRLRLAVELDIGHAISTGLLLTGLLLLPGVAATPGARLRRVLDGLILAACAFYVIWALVVEPWFDQVGPAMMAAVLLAFAAIGILVVTVREATAVRQGADADGSEAAEPISSHRAVLLVCAVATLATVSGTALIGAVLFGSTVAIVGAAAVYAVSQLAVAAVVCSTGRLLEPLDERTGAGFGISVVPLTVALVASFARLAFAGSMDDVGVSAGAVIGGLVVAQQILARIDIRRYADRLRDSEAHFRRMAHTDALTGLANRRELLATLHEQLYRDDGPPFVMLAIDLDGFKNINDIRGHDVGDAVLIEVADRLRTNLRPGDLAARLGGDEFVVLMWAGPRESRVICERLLTVLDRPYAVNGGTVFLTVSIGLAGAATADTVEALMRNADVALRFAKQRGKNRVERYDLAYDRWLRRRNQIEHELRGAVERDELMLVYQPVVALPEGRVAGVEALLRWHHPRLGPVPPDEFIPVAEESGLISGLGAFVLHAACHQLAQWLADGHDVYLSVNASVRELHTPEYATQVADVLRAHRLPPERLVIEVTEHAVALDVDQLVSRLATLRGAGVRVALDDFGSGYSSLGQLRTLPVDILKIDRTVLAEPDGGAEPEGGDSGARFAPTLVDIVVRLGHRLGLDVVAEGITEEAQRRMLIEADCRYAQGDLFGRPMPAERVETLFVRSPPLRLETTGSAGAASAPDRPGRKTSDTPGSKCGTG